MDGRNYRARRGVTFEAGTYGFGSWVSLAAHDSPSTEEKMDFNEFCSFKKASCPKTDDIS
jgi:hypothetical protein